MLPDTLRLSLHKVLLHRGTQFLGAGEVSGDGGKVKEDCLKTLIKWRYVSV